MYFSSKQSMKKILTNKGLSIYNYRDNNKGNLNKAQVNKQILTIIE